MKRQGFIGLMVLALVASLATWWSGEGQRELATKGDALQPRGPGYFMNGVNAVTMDQQGRLSQRLLAERVEQLPEGGGNTLIAPHIVLYQDSAKLWTVSASRGEIDPKGEQVKLRGKVQIERIGNQHQGPLKLTTESLDLYPPERRASGDEGVLIVDPSSRTEAVGVRFDLESDRIELLSQVRSDYENPDL